MPYGFLSFLFIAVGIGGMAVAVMEGGDLTLRFGDVEAEAMAKGAVSGAQHCRMLDDFQKTLNRQYVAEADGGVKEVPQYDFPIAKCEAALHSSNRLVP